MVNVSPYDYLRRLSSSFLGDCKVFDAYYLAPYSKVGRLITELYYLFVKLRLISNV
jgi:hypothetical protein